jgi:hypothetical protein
MSKKVPRTFNTLIFAVMLGASMSACSTTSWKEEVQLHDGSKIIVERSVQRGGRHEIGQQPPVKEESLSFHLPGADSKRITWLTEFGQDIGFADFMPLLLDIYQGASYLVTAPVGCLSYNKWGRPNPPYVIFRYDGKAWQKIPLKELPVEFRTPNLIISSPDNKVAQLGKSFVESKMIQEINDNLSQPEYRSILREPLPIGRCPQYSSSPKAPNPILPSSPSTIEKQGN